MVGTTDEAIALIPPGWRLRLYQEVGDGWTAELHSAAGFAVEEADAPAEAIRRATAEVQRH